MKDKFLASGAFEQFKARLVAGDHQQDKSLYKDLRSPTIATSHVLTIAALAAKEGRRVWSKVTVHVMIDADMTELLC